MLETRHQLGFRIESADEVRVVGEFGSYRFDRHFPFNAFLSSAIYDPETALADDLNHLVTADTLRSSARGSVEEVIMAETEHVVGSPEVLQSKLADVVETDSVCQSAIQELSGG
jgi:hypothetical protein